MRKFMITVNGKSYEVEVEEITSGQQEARQAAPAAPQTAHEQAGPQAPAAPAAPRASAQAPAGTEEIVSPMPGTILKVNVGAGQTVKRGEVLAVLEAMKMENEIMAPRDATIAAVSVAQGDSVDSGDLLFAIN
ncbi:MAG: biotin/lipoyl-binding protein [Clostridiales bacterium]|nr:biotin/lipoyl-binding protein [Clostridiales bacterium]